MHSKKKLPKNYMDLIFVPEPNLTWNKNKQNQVVLDMVNSGFFHSIAQKFFHKPKVSHITLDQYGTTLWLALDGTNTVYDIVHLMEETFSDEKERMLDRVVTFLHTLQANHFITQK